MAEELVEKTAELEINQKKEIQDERECGICLQSIKQLNDVRRLECDHIFCMNCLRKSMKHEEIHKCVVCREEFDSDLESLKIEHLIDDPTQHDDKSVYSIQTHRCSVHTREITTMGCKNCLSVFCCECLNESLMCPYYEVEGFHKLCSFGALPDYFNDKMDEEKMLLHRMKFKLEDCDKQLLSTCDNMEDNGRDVYDLITKDSMSGTDKNRAQIVEDYLVSLRIKRDECSEVIKKQINRLENLAKEKEAMMNELKPEDFKFEVEIFTREVGKILKSDLPDFRVDVITVTEGAADFNLQYDNFKLDYEIEIPTSNKPTETPENPMNLQIKNIYLHDSSFYWLSSNGPNHPEYYKMPNPSYASSTKVIDPWFLEKHSTRLIFAYPIVAFREDSAHIFVFTEHSLTGRYSYPVRTLFRWAKITEKMTVMFRTTQFIKDMTMDGEYIRFRGDWGRRWRVRKEFVSDYKYSVLTANPRYSPSYGIERC